MNAPISVNRSLDASFCTSNSITIFFKLHQSNAIPFTHIALHLGTHIIIYVRLMLMNTCRCTIYKWKWKQHCSTSTISIHNLCSSIYHFAGEQSWVMDYLHILTNIIFMAFSRRRCSKIPLLVYRMINMEQMNKVKMKSLLFLHHLQWKTIIK